MAMKYGSKSKNRLRGSKAAGRLSEVPMGKRVSPITAHSLTHPSLDRVKDVMAERAKQFAASRSAAAAHAAKKTSKSEGKLESWTRRNPSGTVTTVHRR